MILIARSDQIFLVVQTVDGFKWKVDEGFLQVWMLFTLYINNLLCQWTLQCPLLRWWYHLVCHQLYHEHEQWKFVCLILISMKLNKDCLPEYKKIYQSTLVYKMLGGFFCVCLFSSRADGDSGCERSRSAELQSGNVHQDSRHHHWATHSQSHLDLRRNRRDREEERTPHAAHWLRGQTDCLLMQLYIYLFHIAQNSNFQMFALLIQ